MTGGDELDFILCEKVDARAFDDAAVIVPVDPDFRRRRHSQPIDAVAGDFGGALKLCDEVCR